MTVGPFTQLDQLYGACSVTGATGASDAGVGAQFREGRITATARSGAGVYTATMSPGVDVGESIVQVQLHKAGVAAETIYAFQTSDTNIAVTTFNAAGAAADLDWKLSIRKVRQIHA